jgi:hypothetical protein
MNKNRRRLVHCANLPDPPRAGPGDRTGAGGAHSLRTMCIVSRSLASRCGTKRCRDPGCT